MAPKSIPLQFYKKSHSGTLGKIIREQVTLKTLAPDEARLKAYAKPVLLSGRMTIILDRMVTVLRSEGVRLKRNQLALILLEDCLGTHLEDLQGIDQEYFALLKLEGEQFKRAFQ